MTSQRHDRHTHQQGHDRRPEGILIKKTPPELHLDRTEKHHRKQLGQLPTTPFATLLSSTLAVIFILTKW
ncbi:hypothetical protein EDC01DRAFT_777469 [Geopyxis carbonaria]|nr:hypothetical protein EDC01DRAFT_777469 [Geopyxis carbonaria]